MSDSENNDIILSTEDYTGKRVVFTRKKWEEKKVDHTELNKKTFLKCIERAINNPDEAWEDYQDYKEYQGKKKTKRCCYKKYSVGSYAKVVVWFKRSPRQVITAYEIDDIKERQYPELNRLV